MPRATIAVLLVTVLVATSWAAPQGDAERARQDSAGASPEFMVAGTPYARVTQQDPGPRTAHSTHAGGQVPLYRALDVPADPDRYHHGTNEILIEAPQRPDPDIHGIEDIRPLGSLTGFWVATVADPFDAPRIADDMRSRDGVVDAYPSLEVRAVPTLIPDDPLYPDQWHHRNVAQHALAQYKIDVRSHLAHDTVLGSGAHVSVVDDALQYTHPDLATGRYDPANSFDYCDDDPDPAASASEPHGTAVTGLVAAEAGNALGVAGVAPGTAFSAIRFICSGVSGSEFIEIVDSTWSEHDVSSNSWGLSGGPATTYGLSMAEHAAYVDGVTNGRSGLGKIYVYAAGNDHSDGDDAAYEGVNNQRYMIAVGAVSNLGRPSVYSEGCACLLVTAPSNGGTFGLVTTDLVGSDGYSSTDYTCAGGQSTCFGGTSGATPIVSGVVALMLEANPALTWQEVQWILAETANTDFLEDGHTLRNAAGVAWGHRVGFGVVDAHKAVARAAAFPGLPPEQSASVTDGTDTPIPDGTGVWPSSPSPGPVVTYELPIAGDFEVRTATLTMDITHTFENDVRVLLESPSGTVTTILPGRPANAGADIVDFPVAAHAFRGERSAGSWKAHFMDIYADFTGTVDELTLDVHGHAAVNDAPTALAAPPQDATTGETVTLDASGSTDPDQDALAFAWAQHKGPAVTLDDPSSPTPSFTAPSGPATLVFGVEVSDGTATDTALAVVHVT